MIKNSRLKEFGYNVIFALYDNLYRPIKVFCIRKKKHIKVLFVLHNLGAWKTETLYRRMLSHPRFEPVLLVMKSSEEDDRDVIKLYLRQKGYEYIENESGLPLKYVYKADIIFYQKPYDSIFGWEYEFRKNLYALFCYVNYAFHTIDAEWAYPEFLGHCWQEYFENDTCLKGYQSINGTQYKNEYVTGIPVMDELMLPKEAYDNPWKTQPKPKKRIIWAPHHSLDPNGLTHQSTFLDYADFMLQEASKYSEEVQFAFKPHPLLKERLKALWSEEKIAYYYSEWERLENAQFTSGKYYDLFMYSDAMIHDCASFSIEYLYTKNPVLFLQREGDNTYDTLNDFAKECRDLHYKAYSCDDIDVFIQNVISEKDDMRDKREKFYKSSLTPPNNSSASDNIIHSILGE